MVYFKKIVGDYCYLSPTSKSDREHWSKWLKISKDEANKKIEEIHQSMDKYFSIIDSLSGIPIGIISFENINQLYQNCEINIVISNKNDWSDEIITEAIHLGLDFGFNCINMHNVSIWIPENKINKIGFLKNVGFKEMARQRQAVILDDQILDNIYLDIIESEYKSVFINKYLDEMNQYQR